MDDARHQMGREEEERRPVESGLGVLCTEAQADGVPCAEIATSCTGCAKARLACVVSLPGDRLK